MLWQARKRILGDKKSIISTAIINPETNKMAVTVKEIKEVTLRYCTETLKNNKIDDTSNSNTAGSLIGRKENSEGYKLLDILYTYSLDC